MQLLLAEVGRRSRNAIDSIYPATGPLRRELYAKHMECLAAGKTCHARYFLGGNRVGKSRGVGAFEVALHATGLYPDWWDGFRIPESAGAPEIWISGKSNEWLRDNAWKELLGPPGEHGTGMVRGTLIRHVERDSNPAGTIGRVWVKHRDGGTSIIGSKSFSSGRDAYAGTKRWFIWLDEEHPAEIVQECKMRTMATVPGEPLGRILCTLTPLDGITEFIQPLIETQDTPDRRVFFCGWDDVPHLTAEAKRVMLADPALTEEDKKARTQGIPSTGQGQIYPYLESSYLEDPPEIPEHWPRVFAMDTGWKVTCALWGAHDRDSDVVHIYGEHYLERAEIPIHAAAIKARGDWIPGVADAAAINPTDGEQLIGLYRKQGLILTLPDKSVWAGINSVKNRFATGRLKISRVCVNLRRELPLYRWDKGKIIKKDDHCSDTLRYIIHSGLELAKCDPRMLLRAKPERYPMTNRATRGGNWMA